MGNLGILAGDTSSCSASDSLLFWGTATAQVGMAEVCTLVCSICIYEDILSLLNICITLWLFNIAMEHGPFIDDFPINTSIYKGFSMAMLNNQRVY